MIKVGVVRSKQVGKQPRGERLKGSGRTPISDWFEQRERRSAFPAKRSVHEKSRVVEYSCLTVLGAVIASGTIAAVHFAGVEANAGVGPGSNWSDVVSPATSISSKASLITDTSKLDVSVEPVIHARQVVKASVKGAFLVDKSLVNASAKADRSFKLVETPPLWKLEYSWKLGKERKEQVLAARKFRVAQHNCLARAIYFEARGETELGQYAVARVIMNRVKNSAYPGNICDVVYQGSHRRNSCQFSFACDGIKDQPRHQKSWSEAKRIASHVMKGAEKTQVVSAATHYHADYVKPKWSGAMKRIIKIGRHIFYDDS